MRQAANILLRHFVPHSACARRAPFVARATFPPFRGGITPSGEGFYTAMPLCFDCANAPLNMTVKKLSCHPEIGLLDRPTKDPAARRTPNKIILLPAIHKRRLFYFIP